MPLSNVTETLRTTYQTAQNYPAVQWLHKTVRQITPLQAAGVALGLLCILGVVYRIFRNRKNTPPAPPSTPKDSPQTNGSSSPKNPPLATAASTQPVAAPKKAGIVEDKLDTAPGVPVIFWPQDLTAIRINEEDQAMLRIMTVFQLNQGKQWGPTECSYFASGRMIPLTDSAGKKIQKAVPRTLVFVQNAILVLLGRKGGMTTLEGGSERQTIKLGWELLRGKFIVKKNVAPYEMLIYQNLIQNRPKGSSLPRVYGYRKLNDKKTGVEKYQVFEKRYEGNLASLYAKASATNQKLACNFGELYNLLNAVAKFHSLTFTFTQGSNKWEVPGYHGDPSFKNVVYKQKRGSNILQYRLIDFGFASPTTFGGTPGWRSPEYEKAKREFTDAEKVLAFNQRYGRKKDIWGFGLLVGSILRGIFNDNNPQLPCFTFILNRVRVLPDKSVDCDLSDLTQAEVDAEITGVRSFKPSEDLAVLEVWQKMWTLINQMLQVDPDQRIVLKDS